MVWGQGAPGLSNAPSLRVEGTAVHTMEIVDTLSKCLL